MSDQSIARGGPAPDHPFLAFLNTVSDDGKTRAINTFENGRDLIAYLAAGGLSLPAGLPDDPHLAPLLAFREAAYGVLSASAARRTPTREDVLSVETVLKRALVDADLLLDRGGLQFRPDPKGGLLDALAVAFLDLTTSPDFGRLSECRRCTRMFIDRGRGRGRRWCDMSVCGNRAKAESFRARQRALRDT